MIDEFNRKPKLVMFGDSYEYGDLRTMEMSTMEMSEVRSNTNQWDALFNKNSDGVRDDQS